MDNYYNQGWSGRGGKYSGLTLDRIFRHLKLVEGLIWSKKIPLSVTLLHESAGTPEEFGLKSNEQVSQLPNISGKKMSYGSVIANYGWAKVWFRIDIPESAQDATHIFWKVNGESVVYCGNKLWCGLDTGHLWCRLPRLDFEHEQTLYIATSTYQTGLWTRQKEKQYPEVLAEKLIFYQAEAVVRDESIWSIYQDLKLLYELADYEFIRLGCKASGSGFHPPLENAPPYVRKLLAEVDIAMDFFDNDDYINCSSYLKKFMRNNPSSNSHGKLSIVGNSHLDLVWLWPERVTKEKNLHTILTSLRILEEDSNVIFTMSQPKLLDDLRNDYPEIYKQVRSRVKEGRWELIGGFYVEADTHLVSGEGLVRCGLLGQKFFIRETGKISETLWLPDTFGFSQCIPQIAKGLGMKNFYTTKLAWSTVNRFPYTAFIWESLDGSSLISYAGQVGYESRGYVDELLKNVQTNYQSGIFDESLIAIGYGDGGGGLNDEHYERVKRLSNFAILPQSNWSRADDFFKRLEEKRDDLPHYRGELDLEYHRGTYTTQHRIKQTYRAAEQALQILEAALVATKHFYDTEKWWKRVVFAQFHDALPGSSIALVYDELIQELNAIISSATETATNILSENNKRDTAIAFFNPHAVGGTWIRQIEYNNTNTTAQIAAVDSGGTQYQTQKLRNGMLAFQVILEGLEVKKFFFVTKPNTFSEPEPVLEQDSEKVVGNRVEALFSSSGCLDKLTIDGSRFPLLASARFMIHADYPHDFDAWEIDYSVNHTGKPAFKSMQLSISESGTLITSISGKTHFGKGSYLSVTYTVQKDTPFLFISADIDWQEENRLLRYEIPIDYRGMTARFGTPFGSIERVISPGSPQSASQWEQSASRWVAVTDSAGHGISIISASHYGFSIRQSLLSISLLRSPLAPNAESTSSLEKYLDKGSYHIEFAIGKYTAKQKDMYSSTAQAAELLFTGPLLNYGEDLHVPFKFIQQGSLTVSWVKPTDDESGFILRMHETAGISGEFVLQASNYRGWICDLLDNRLAEIPKKENLLEHAYRPYDLISLELERV